MATSAPTTAAPAGAPETDTRPVSQLASDVTLLIYRVRSLAYGIDRANDELPATDGNDDVLAPAHILNFTALIEGVCREALALLDDIECGAARLQKLVREAA